MSTPSIPPRPAPSRSPAFGRKDLLLGLGGLVAVFGVVALMTAMISNMMAMQHRTNMMVINNIGSSNTRYEYKYVYRYR